ncbi:MAG: nucleotidyltransferase domain-containing protein [Candidatus Freyarchaeota archaeon]|nr:nucleotidyltransferase domain-containing protein [Candidatus Jordarchaeia archaeon]MBS7268809.1 nucleotidyltransferase domain-containing protein [Candidatus Jordarchaeia archaeon]MBS7279154.1 nucleotidyltransferase domain-containing protein [Candidatus Jordarchaeia archaeon]
MLSEQEKDIITKSFREEFKDSLVSLVLFGSFAQGREKPTSDIDILAIVEEDYSHMEKRVIGVDTELTWLLKRAVRCLPFTPDDFNYMVDTRFPLVLGVASGYQVLFDTSGFFEKKIREIFKDVEAGKIKYYPRSGIWVVK